MSNSASGPEIAREPFGDLDALTLREPATGSEARLAPSLGSNLFSFQTSVGGQRLDVLPAPPSSTELRRSPTWYGVPILFPYPGRIRAARFSFAGKEVALPATDGRGNAIHGCVRDKPWRVVGEGASAEEGAVVVTEIDTESRPEMLAEWPWPFRLTMDARLKGGALTLSYLVENVGRAPMPMGFGLHPYFGTPLGRVGTRDENQVAVAAERLWDQPDALPTGQTWPVGESIDLRSPRPIGSLPTNHEPGLGTVRNLLFSRFEATHDMPSDAPGGIESRIRDAAAGLEVEMAASAGFRALVLFCPSWNSSLSLEPHTCTPDAFNLASRGVDAGMIVLESGATWRGWVRLTVRELKG